jgi:crossover junction endodeoxyribonuclease RuvC
VEGDRRDILRVLGIDPGTKSTGFGLIDVHNSPSRPEMVHVINGSIRTEVRYSFPLRLKQIYLGITGIIESYRPSVVAIEDVFYANNVKSALKLGHSRGAAILAAVNSGVPIESYSPLEVKKAVVGFGRAQKEQVQKMVQVLLKLPSTTDTDASDALAVAICHIHNHLSRQRLIGLP